MSLRRVILLLISVGLGALLVYALMRTGGIDFHVLVHQLRGANRFPLAMLVLLNILLVSISTKKWRMVDKELRNSSDSIPSRTASFAVTSAGMALGLIFPVQLGMSAARTLGTYMHGKAFRRGTAGTLFEQSFDLLVVSFLAVASVVTRIVKGGSAVWWVSAAAMIAVALLAIEPTIKLLGWIASHAPSDRILSSRMGSLLASFSELRDSGLLNVALARRLVLLSSVRFVVVVLMAHETAVSIGAQIPLWNMAAAVPFVVAATVTAITPGGVGVNEITYCVALNVFGTPLAVAAAWALANRILATAACFVVVGIAASMFGIQRIAVLTIQRTGCRTVVGQGQLPRR